MNNYQLLINNYQLPEGYRQTEVGVIPEDWKVRTIGETVTLINGRAFKPSDWSTYGLPIIRIQNLNDPMGVYNYYEGAVEDRYYVNHGDILFAWSGTKESSFGARMWHGQKAILNQHIFRVVPNEEKITAQYILLALKKFQEEIEKKSHGFKSSFVHIRKSDLENTYLTIPPLPEQRAIAATLSDVDALIASLDKLIAKQRHLKTATMQQLLTGKKRLPGFGKGKGYKQTEVGLIPEDWECVRLGEVVTLQRGFDLPNRLRQSGTIPIVSSSGVIDTHNQATALGPGVVTGRYGTIGEVFFVEKDFWPLNTTLFVSNFYGNDPKFIYFFLRTIDYKTYSGKSGVPGVNRNDLHEILVGQPLVEEQRAIATVLSDMDATISALETRRAKTQAIKQGMMQELLTGRTRLV